MTKKKLILTLYMLIATMLIGCSNNDKISNQEHRIKPGSDMTFYVATDIHYLSKSLTDQGEAFRKFVSSGDGKQLNYINEILDAFIFDIKNKKPDILIISGDLTNNGEKKSHMDLAQKLKEVESSGASVYVIPGNHDISNPYARGFKGDKQYVADKIDSSDFSRIYNDYGYREAVLRDKNSLSYLAAPSQDVWLLMLDTSQYKNNLSLGFPQGDGSISKETLKWIKECSDLAKEKGAKIVTVMHHSLISHNDELQKGFILNNSKEVVGLFQEWGLDLFLSGHIHVQDISSNKKDTSTMYDIATGSLAVYPQYYGVLKYSYKDSSFDYNTSIVDVEGWSKTAGVSDANLNNFKEYSKDFFGSFAYDMAYNELKKDKSLSENQVKSMSETVRTLNLRFFSGLEYLNSDDVINSEGIRLWDSSSNNFLKRYIKSIINDKDTDDNKLHINLKF